jgi:ABC-type multidrug transport system fused ATPase/permease subunit
MMDSLEPWLRTRTVIMVAHRLSSLQNADKIVLLNSGKAMAEGTHAELYSTNGLYRQLYDKQTTKEN